MNKKETLIHVFATTTAQIDTFNEGIVDDFIERLEKNGWIFVEKKLDIHIGNFKVMTELRNGKRVAICPNCGDEIEGPFHPDFAAETGYPYCSQDCAKEHVNANAPEGGY